MTRARDTWPLAGMAAVFGLIGIGFWAVDDLKAWLRPHFARAAFAVTPATPIGHCTAPLEGEHLVVMLKRKGERIELDSCFFAGSRGTYRATRAKGGS